MPTRSKSTRNAQPPLGVESPGGYLSRELSTLAFNERVLEEASNPRQPLLERLKFAAVFASNLDEFFTLRLSGLRDHARAGDTTRALDDMTPAEELAAIRQALLPSLDAHQRAFAQELVPRLAEQGIVV